MAAEGQQEEDIYLHRPEAREARGEYQPPPPASNPVLRGRPLYYLAQLVANSSLVQRILYSLNGFGNLRHHPALDGVEPRYVPTVIRAPKDLGAATALREGEYLAKLNAVDWDAKAPPSSNRGHGEGERRVLRSCLEYHEAYRSGAVTPVDVVEALLPLVRREEGGRHATAFLCVRAERVRRAAEESAERWRRGRPRSVLDGVVMAVKDEEDLAGHTRSLGSRLDFARADDATSFCVQKWLDAGAICLGKTSMHELGLDITNNNPVHGTPRNPYNPGYYCGGSSGGSAYAVAAGLVPFAMGNDGGGSIRIPAAFCGLFGLKPTHGRVSIRPTANSARSTAVAGPLAANMVDLEVAYRVMAEPDGGDGESAMFAPPVPRPVGKGRGGRKALGIFRPWFDRAEKEVREVCWGAIEWLERERGYEVVDIDIPMVHEAQTAHALTIMTEILSNCDPATLSALTPPNRILLAVAAQTSSVDFLQAQKLRNRLMQHLSWLFARERGRELLIVTPTTPNPGIPLHPATDLTPAGLSDGNAQLRTMEFATLANFTGNPAVTVPVGFLAPATSSSHPPSSSSSSPSSGVDVDDDAGPVPVGLMALADWGGEETLLAFGYDGEAYLHGGMAGGRAEVVGERGVDVLGLARARRRGR